MPSAAGRHGKVSMSQPAKLQEPTMEEILASIRRIIAEDDGVRPAPAASKPATTLEPARILAADERADIVEMVDGFDDPQVSEVAANDVFAVRGLPPKPN